MFGSDRPIALLIIRVRSVPLAPTRVPATTSTTECSTKPLAATARPVKELRSEMSTGTSAPPIGSTKAIAEDEGEDGDDDDEPRVGADAGDDCQYEDAGGHDAVQDLLARVGDRPPRHQLLQLGEGDRRARERHAADDDTEDDLDHLVDGQPARRSLQELATGR